MPHAYDWLLARFRTTGKSIAIGWVFETGCHSGKGILVDRRENYQYGYPYEDFFTVKVASLHSLMLDLSQLDVAKLKVFEGRVFLDDYLLLQLEWRDNDDWKGLAQDFYIGV